MFIPHELLLDFKRGDQLDPEHCRSFCERLGMEGVAEWDVVNDPFHKHACTMLVHYLRQLPPLEKTEKIGLKLHEIAAQNGTPIRWLRWWDVGMAKRHLLALVARRDPTEGERSVLLMWKKSEQDANQARRTHHLASFTYSWGFDRAAPGNWRFEIECEVFEHIKENFDRWLASPLPPLPSGAHA